MLPNPPKRQEISHIKVPGVRIRRVALESKPTKMSASITATGKMANVTVRA